MGSGGGPVALRTDSTYRRVDTSWLWPGVSELEAIEKETKLDDPEFLAMCHESKAKKDAAMALLDDANDTQPSGNESETPRAKTEEDLIDAAMKKQLRIKEGE